MHSCDINLTPDWYTYLSYPPHHTPAARHSHNVYVSVFCVYITHRHVTVIQLFSWHRHCLNCKLFAECPSSQPASTYSFIFPLLLIRHAICIQSTIFMNWCIYVIRLSAGTTRNIMLGNIWFEIEIVWSDIKQEINWYSIVRIRFEILYPVRNGIAGTPGEMVAWESDGAVRMNEIADLHV